MSLQTRRNTVIEFLSRKLDDLQQYDATMPAKTLPPKKFGKLIEKIEGVLMSARFRRQLPPDRAPIRDAIRHAVTHGEPVHCIIGHGPVKNRQNCALPYADWGEFLAYCHLMVISRNVQAIYPPGLRFSLYLDDGRAEQANNVSVTQMDAYRESLVVMLATTGLNRLVTDVVSLKTLTHGPVYAACLAEAEQTVRGWQLDVTDQTMWETMRARALRNLPDPMGVSPDEQEEAARQAVLNYLICYEAEQLFGIWSQPNAVHMWYSERPELYQIFSLKKGCVAQPWQGEGALLARPDDTPEPIILTRTRREKTVCLETLDLPFQLPYLERISLVAERDCATILPETAPVREMAPVS